MSAPPREDALSLLQQELAPYPGRLAGSLRDMTGILLAVVIGMTLEVPGMSLALALLYLMQRERPGLTLRVSLQIFSGSVFACLATVFWVQLTDGVEVARFLGLAIGVFIAAFCMVATTIPLFWTIAGFYGFVNLASWDAHRTPHALVSASLYNVASLGIVVLSTLAVEYLLGTRRPSEDLDHEFRKRLSAIRSYFHRLSVTPSPENSADVARLHQALVQLAHAGDGYLNELYDRLRESLPESSKLPLGIHYRIGLLLEMLYASVAYGIRLPKEQDESYRQAYQSIVAQCDALLSDSPKVAAPTISEQLPQQLQDILRQLGEYSRSLQQVPTSAPVVAEVSPEPHVEVSVFSDLFLPGSFKSTDALYYALKLTLAAMVCYLTYNAVAWPSILTCVVTVLFTGLTSTGAMKQKQLYRFSGAAIGGGLAILTVSVMFPNMDSITSLIVLLAPLALLAGWVTRSPHIGYVGVQIAFAFFLTALPGFSPATQISPARDRVIGVSLGILVMWFIFDQLWPIRTSDALRGSLMRIRTATQELRQLIQSGEFDRGGRAFKRLRSAVSLELINVQQLSFAAGFEVGRHRKREMAKTRRMIEEIEHSSAEFYGIAGQS